MREDVLEGEAVELPAAEDETEAAARPLPGPAAQSQLSAWKGEVRTAALAAAGGIVAGAATVAAVRATRSPPSRRRSRRALRNRERPATVVASRSFLVDVHLLDNR